MTAAGWAIVAGVVAVAAAVAGIVLGRSTKGAEDANADAWRQAKTAGQLAAEADQKQAAIDAAAEKKQAAITKAASSSTPEADVAALANARKRTPEGP